MLGRVFGDDRDDFRAARQSGAIEDEPYDEGMFLLGLQAAAWRVPFLPTRVGLGSDILRDNDRVKMVTSPFEDGEQLVAVPALTMDAAFVHMNRSDARGNGQYLGPDPYMDDLFLGAATKRFLSTERIVATEDLAKEGPPQSLLISRLLVDGVIEAPKSSVGEGWYDTGDIVEVDEHRFVTILGRAKRFSKIAGEMVSLTAVETKLQEAFPGENFAVVAIPDEKKGEQLILFTTIAQPERAVIAEGLKSRGASDLMIPKVLVHLDEIPLLGSGKTDYVTLTRISNEGANG